MQVKSVNIGLPKEVEWKGEKIITGIFKYPSAQPLEVRKINIEGDGQADLVNHGGINKAVYIYPFENYSYWKSFLNTEELEAGIFGENLTTEGILEAEVATGDEFRFGSAVLMAIQPRFPCYKLGIRFNNEQMVRYFTEARRFGIYFRVIKEGILQKGDSIQLIKKSGSAVTIQHVVDNFVLPKKNKEKIQEIVHDPFLPEKLKDRFRKFL